MKQENQYNLASATLRPDITSEKNTLCAAYTAGANVPAFWSGPRIANGFATLPAIGSRVLVNFNNFGPGTVKAYFTEGEWIGCEVLVDKIPKAFADRGHSGLVHAFGIEVSQLPASPVAQRRANRKATNSQQASTAAECAPVSVRDAQREFNARQGQTARAEYRTAHGLANWWGKDGLWHIAKSAPAEVNGLRTGGYLYTDETAETREQAMAKVDALTPRTLKLSGKMRVISTAPGQDDETRALLVRCEEFIAGFEDDETQTGLAELLADLRARIK